jgi:hypothetical protein
MSNVASLVTKLQILGGNQYSLLMEITAYNLLVSVTVVRCDRSSAVVVGSGHGVYDPSFHNMVLYTYSLFHLLALVSHSHEKFMLWRQSQTLSSTHTLMIPLF